MAISTGTSIIVIAMKCISILAGEIEVEVVVDSAISGGT